MCTCAFRQETMHVYTYTHVYTRVHTSTHVYTHIYIQNTSTVTEMTDVSIPHRHGGSSQCAAERLGMTSLAETSMLVPLSGQTCCNATKTIEIP